MKDLKGCSRQTLSSVQLLVLLRSEDLFHSFPLYIEIKLNILRDLDCSPNPVSSVFKLPQRSKNRLIRKISIRSYEHSVLSELFSSSKVGIQQSPYNIYTCGLFKD